VCDERGEPIVDDSFLVILHGHHEDQRIKLPGKRWGATWIRVLDTERGFAVDDHERYAANSEIDVLARCLWVLRRET
jgi:glycogen operon protein